MGRRRSGKAACTTLVRDKISGINTRTESPRTTGETFKSSKLQINASPRGTGFSSSFPLLIVFLRLLFTARMKKPKFRVPWHSSGKREWCVFSDKHTVRDKLTKKRIKERGQQVPSASALHTSASKVKEDFQGSLSGSIEAQFFSGSRKVFTVMSRFTEWVYKLVPSCPDNNRSFFPMPETPFVSNKSNENEPFQRATGDEMK